MTLRYSNSKEPGKKLLPRYPISLAKNCVSLYILRQEIAQKRDTRPIAEVLAEIAATIPAAELARLPADFTDQLDHYIYGTPKR